MIDWLRLEQSRRERDGEINRREALVDELARMRSARKPDPSQLERIKLLEQGVDCAKGRLDKLYEERRQYEELTKRLIQAEFVVFPFAAARDIDTGPLRRLLMERNLDYAEAAVPILRQLLGLFDREREAGAVGDQPIDQLPPVGSRLDERAVPAQFREGGKPEGVVLTAPYLADNPNWLLNGPYLTKHFGSEPDKELKHRIKVGCVLPASLHESSRLIC
jgi:hypothetical protein